MTFDKVSKSSLADLKGVGAAHQFFLSIMPA